MATPTAWADKHRQRAAGARSDASTSHGGGPAGDWLAESVAIDGHEVQRWKLAAAAVVAFFVGPGALGYAIVLCLLYLAYTRLYLTGTTPALLWADYTEAAAAQPRKKGKKGTKAT